MFMPILLGLIAVGLLGAYWYERHHQVNRIPGPADRPVDMRAEQSRAEVVFHANRNDIRGR